jgi:hypothetical protein
LETTIQPSKWNLIGISLLSGALLTLEITLTRIFSVTMWYHFAFMAISLALLGGAVAGVWVYLLGPRLPERNVRHQLTLVALLTSAATLLTFWLYLNMPFRVSQIVEKGISGAGIVKLALIYLDLVIPFFMGGMGISLAMSRWSQRAGRVYAFDLVGASAGCLLSVAALTWLGGPGAVVGVAVLMALAGLAFALSTGRRAWQGVAAVWTLAVIALLVLNYNYNWLQVTSGKNPEEDATRIYEKWNSFSRITVYPPTHWPVPFAWGLSRTYYSPDPGHMLMLIDANAGTPIQAFDGDLSKLEFMKYDLPAFAYYLKEHPSVFIIGPGGGRDVLTGIVFQASEITGVELNPAIVQAVRNDFDEYAGHVYNLNNPGIRIVVDEARGYISRSYKTYDIIQASLIDTWAATSAGAFALSENSLYTEEAFLTYYQHLDQDGILTMARWYLADMPAEFLRLVSLSLDAWERAGVLHPGQHLVAIANLELNRSTEALGTVLVKRSPFTPEELAQVHRVADQLQFTVLYAPDGTGSGPVAELVNAADRQAFVRDYPLDISSPTDDRPFFFNLIRLGNLMDRGLYASGVYRTSYEAVYVLMTLLAITLLLSAALVVLPLLVASRRRRIQRAELPYLGYFAALGVGFMLVEIPSAQRFSIYLGHPTYSLVVVLFSLLLFSGIGSRVTSRWPTPPLSSRPPAPPKLGGTGGGGKEGGHALRWIFPLLLVLAVAQALAAPTILFATQKWGLPMRITLSVFLLAPLGLLMGMPFPLGIRWLSVRNPAIVAWMWGINGTASVLGSVLSVILALNLGFRITLLVGAGCYLVAATLAATRAP